MTNGSDRKDSIQLSSIARVCPPPKKVQSSALIASAWNQPSVTTSSQASARVSLGDERDSQTRKKYFRSVEKKPFPSRTFTVTPHFDFMAVSDQATVYFLESSPIVSPTKDVGKPISLELTKEEYEAVLTQFKSTFDLDMSPPPKSPPPNFYNTFKVAVAKPYSPKSQAPSYYATKKNRSDIVFGDTASHHVPINIAGGATN
jgi:hypothetical protein